VRRRCWCRLIAGLSPETPAGARRAGAGRGLGLAVLRHRRAARGRALRAEGHDRRARLLGLLSFAFTQAAWRLVLDPFAWDKTRHRRDAGPLRKTCWTRPRLSAYQPFMPPRLNPSPETLVTRAWADYALLDSGDGRKLERYGRFTVVRPEPQCFWSPRDPSPSTADAVFDPTQEDESGRWRFAGQSDRHLPAGLARRALHQPLHALPPSGLLPGAGRELGMAG
jgi:hypothetical protein